MNYAKSMHVLQGSGQLCRVKAGAIKIKRRELADPPEQLAVAAIGQHKVWHMREKQWRESKRQSKSI